MDNQEFVFTHAITNAKLSWPASKPLNFQFLARAMLELSSNSGEIKFFFHLVFWLVPKEKKELTYLSRSRGFFYQYLSGISGTFV